MIREDEIREFQEIIGTYQADSDEENEIIEDQIEDAVETEETIEEKTDNPTISILFITGIFGLAFFFSVFIGTVLYIYAIQITEEKLSKTGKPAQNLKIPGIERLFTDPPAEGPDSKIKVWVVCTAIPPRPVIFGTSYAYDDIFGYSDIDDVDL